MASLRMSTLARMRMVAAGGFAVSLGVCIFTDWDAPGLFALVACAISWAICTNTINRRRITEAYKLLARIGEGELAATTNEPGDELTLRLHRGIARAQRGYAEALARAELERDEMRALLSAIDNGLVSLDSHLRIRSANSVAERLLGLPPGQYRNRMLAEVLRQPELLRFVESALVSNAPTTAQLTFSGGSVESILVAAETIRGSAGQIDGILLAIDDMTRVRRLENLRTDFAANVSHELRTPITNIKGYVETLLEVGCHDPRQSAAFLSVIHSNAVRLSTLIEDTLALAFLEQPMAGKRFEISRVQVAEVVRDVIDQLKPAAFAKSMDIQVDADESLLVECNSSLAAQALLNLVSNAIRYAPEKTAIQVRAYLSGAALEVSVTDSGPGIDPVHFPRLFERFYRVDAARSRELGGTGLGLAIVKHIMMLHGGSVDVQCPPKCGSVFSLRFPHGSRAARVS